MPSPSRTVHPRIAASRKKLRLWRVGDEIANDHAGLERFGVNLQRRFHVRKEADWVALMTTSVSSGI